MLDEVEAEVVLALILPKSLLLATVVVKVVIPPLLLVVVVLGSANFTVVVALEAGVDETNTVLLFSGQYVVNLVTTVVTTNTLIGTDSVLTVDVLVTDIIPSVVIDLTIGIAVIDSEYMVDSNSCVSLLVRM